MKATQQQQALLLDLQRLDNEIARARHKLASSPVAAQIAGLAEQLSAIRRDLVQTQTSSDDMQRAVNRSEEELQRVRKRLERDREMAAQGASARVQRELDHELTSLLRRVSDLEDAELEMLDRHAQLTDKVAELQQAEARLRAQLEDSSADEEEQSRVARTEIEELAARRGALVAGLDLPLLSRYDTIRAGSPVAVAELSGSQCGGCRLELPPSEVAVMLAAPADEFVSCEECGCLLVRS